MNIFDTPLGSDVAKLISSSGGASVACHFKMDWVIPGTGVIEISRIHQMQVLRDYREGAFDVITAIVEVPVGTYQDLLYPNKAILDMDVYRTEASERGVYEGNPTSLTRYKAMLLTLEDHELFDQTYAANTEREKEANTMLVSVQLINKTIYLYKDTCFATILGPGSIEDYLYYFMSRHGSWPCSIHPLDNGDDAENILIPDNISLMGLANWMQRDGPGLYNHGINTYFQEGMMYVYPIALLTPHEYRRKLHIYRAGNDLAIGTGNTYAIQDGTLSIISAGNVLLPDGESRMIDDREQLEQRYGNAVRWHDPRYQSDVVNATDDAMFYSSLGTNVYGLQDVDVKIQKVHRAHTANGYSQKSIINKTLGRVITIPWQSGNIDLIEPGTEVYYHYMRGLNNEMITGIVDGTMETFTRMEGHQINNVFNIESTLRIRVI